MFLKWPVSSVNRQIRAAGDSKLPLVRVSRALQAGGDPGTSGLGHRHRSGESGLFSFSHSDSHLCRKSSLE